jgi:thiopurine S-methyltransferase
MSEDWLDRWEKGRTGWHEAAGNAGLQSHWQVTTGRVLVPLCGKSPDLAWLAQRGHEVVGVELSGIAARAFFAEQGLSYQLDQDGPLDVYRCTELPVTLYCGDYFSFTAEPFDALYDRGALVALEPGIRGQYVAHTRSLLRPNSSRMIVTLEYDQSLVQGPPYSVGSDELEGYWDDLVRVGETDDIDNCPPKFRAAGLTEIKEVIWRN